MYCPKILQGTDIASETGLQKKNVREFVVKILEKRTNNKEFQEPPF